MGMGRGAPHLRMLQYSRSAKLELPQARQVQPFTGASIGLLAPHFLILQRSRSPKLTFPHSWQAQLSARSSTEHRALLGAHSS
eukprot:CAMPEP_0169415858 /NCGR_PEP_ID=MMETSP1017-20121227/62802_1 /TAXON_ID=342587 /ORGANISM="Karlodinium micrum, Strain CCMP2283" /LENGTH=82 /DNA_ID=CAMNT_0009523745 /DNA_START=261 /DNA_END=506 /DNA_ORIENTATION=+